MDYKFIDGYEDYIIYKSGKIFSLKRNRFIKPYFTTKKMEDKIIE
jgi:ATP-dependent RNA circularization protein (DNA/RNA ligase family)